MYNIFSQSLILYKRSSNKKRIVLLIYKMKDIGLRGCAEV